MNGLLVEDLGCFYSLFDDSQQLVIGVGLEDQSLVADAGAYLFS